MRLVTLCLGLLAASVAPSASVRAQAPAVEKTREVKPGVNATTPQSDAFVARIDNGPPWLKTWMACAQAAKSPEQMRPCSKAMIAGQMDRVVSLQESPNGEVVAALHYRGQKSRVSFYDATTLANIGGAKISGLAIRNTMMRFSDDGAYLAIGLAAGKRHKDGRIIIGDTGVTTIIAVATGKMCESKEIDATMTFWRGKRLVAVGRTEGADLFGTVTLNRTTCDVVKRTTSVPKAVEIMQQQYGARLTAPLPPIANLWYYAWDPTLKMSASIGPTKDGVAVKCGGRTHPLKMASDVIKLFDDGSRAVVGQGAGIDIVQCTR